MSGVENVSSAWSTSLNVKQLADLFKRTATEAGPQSKLDKFAAKKNAKSRQSGLLQNSASFADMRNELSFFTPSDDSPFSQFEDSPAFSVGASIPHKSGVPMVIHMSVMDNGASREAEFQSVYIEKFGETRANRKKAEDALDRFHRALGAADKGSRQVR